MKNKVILILSIFILITLISQVSANDLDQISIESNDLEKIYGEDGKYSVSITNNSKPVADENVTFFINGVDYTRKSDENGMASLNINLNEGEYGVLSTFKNISVSGHIKILDNSNSEKDSVYFEADNLNKINGEVKTFTATLKNANGEAVTNQEVKFRVNGVDYLKSTDNNGQAKLNIRLNTAKISIFAEYEGNSLYKASIASYVITTQNSTSKKDVILTGNNLSQYHGENKAFTILLCDESSLPIANENINFNINGVNYTRQTDDDGTARLNIRLNEGNYTIKAEYDGSTLYNPAVQNCYIISILKPQEKIQTKIESENLTFPYGENKAFILRLMDISNNPLANQKAIVNINGVNYTKTSDNNGIISLTIRLKSGFYTINTIFGQTPLYMASEKSNTIEVLDTVFINNGDNIQEILDSITKKTNVKFVSSRYDNISLNVNNAMTITSNANTKLNGKPGSAVLTLNSSNITVKNMNINPAGMSGIVVNNADNIILQNNNIHNQVNENEIDKYDLNKSTLLGNGIKISSSKTLVESNTLELFENGILLENADDTTIKNNSIIKNNFGVRFGENVTNTQIYQNNISESIGWLTTSMVEGPTGYGISMQKSGVNVTIKENIIKDNYMGVFIDAKNCSGIVIRGNEISYSVIEGLTVNENYIYAEGAKLNIENNAIYNNAKGPSLMILGEISANLAGIYGPGEFNDSLKLVMDSNWYGTTVYTKWGENSTGAGTLCPRIKTTLIDFKLTYKGNCTYEAEFYNNNNTASELPDFDYYMTLNYYTDKEQEVIMHVHEGKGIIEFSKENYFEINNIIEGSSGSLRDSDRPFRVTYTYNVPDDER